MLALVPAQRALVTTPLEYDLTIRGTGTYAVSIGAERVGHARDPRAARARSGGLPPVGRRRDLTEVLAGVQKRMGRWIGSVKVRGRRRDAAGAARRARRARTSTSPPPRGPAPTSIPTSSGARSPTRSIPPGRRGTRSRSCRRSPARGRCAGTSRVRDGAPVTVERRAPAQPPDAVVSMSRGAFAQLLRGRAGAGGERPAIRGDRAAVATLKALDGPRSGPRRLTRRRRFPQRAGTLPRCRGAVRSGI